MDEGGSVGLESFEAKGDWKVEAMLNHDIDERKWFSDTLIPFNIINMKDIHKFPNLKKRKKKFIHLHTIYRLHTPTTPTEPH